MKKFAKTILVVATSTAVFPIVAGLIYYELVYQKPTAPVSHETWEKSKQKNKD